MKEKKHLLFAIGLIICIGVSTLLSFASIDIATAQAVTGPASDKIEYVRVDRPLAPEALRNGEIDVYIFSILPEAQIEIGTEDPDIEFWEGVSGMDDILLNPAPAPEGELNPFSIKEVRYAMNFIFDRDFIVNEIYKGTAAKMYDYLGPYHPEVPSIADIKLRHGFRYDFELANEMVEDAMVLAGAEKRAGKWYYKDKPVSIKALIRVEDERRDIGDSFAAELEKLGFTIEYAHSTFGPAIDIVYGTDPAAFEWGFYTEGWGIGASRWNTWEPGCWGGSADPDIGDWCANMPGWAEAGWWNYLSPGGRVEILATDIYYGRYEDLADREEKIRECTDIMMQESVRIFGIRELTAYPARRDVKGLTQDMGQGLRGAVWAPREAYKEDTKSLKFANLWVWTETTVWNRFAGFNDVYSVDIGRSTYDPAVWRHPFTASAMPFRADYEVTTAGPDGTLSVPSDAYVWDADADEWVTVGSGVEATSKVSFDLSKFTQSKWHHGIDINMADILYQLASGWDIAEDADKSTRETTLASEAAGYYKTLKGVVVSGDTVEVYIDFYHFDDNEIAIFANFMGGMTGIGDNPWELNAAQEDVVFEKKLLAMDQTASDVWGVPWMSLILNEHAGMVKDSLEELLAEDFFPSNYFTMGGTTYDTLENARARYQASIDWYEDKGILWISNGPFYLNRFDAEAQYAETLAFRDPTYPFEPGDWYYGRPEVPEVVDVALPTITKGIASTIGISMAGPENLAATYIVTEEATGELVIKGEARTTAVHGELEAPLTTEDTDLLDIGGRYVLTVLGKSPDVAFLHTATKRFVVRDPLIVNLGETVEEITGTIEVLSDRLDETSSALATSIDALSGLIGTATDDLSDDIGTVAQAVSETNSNVSKLASNTNTLLYAIVATLIVALIGVLGPFLRKS
jgi:peptide/nickel transport system substrate-binding protein